MIVVMRIFIAILVLMVSVQAKAQEAEKSVTFWDEVRQEPFGCIVYCYDAKGNDLILEAFENAFPILNETGQIKLRNIGNIKTVKIKGDYYSAETFDAANGIPDTIKVDPSGWPYYKFIGYYYPEESLCDTAFTKGLLVSCSDSDDAVNVMVAGGKKNMKKVWFGPAASSMDNNGHLVFCCAGVKFMIVAKDFFTIDVRQVGDGNGEDNACQVKDCPIKPGIYKRVYRNLRLL